MKVLFAGPSLYGAELDLAGIDRRPPASQGDVTTAVLEGAVAIGLIDGHFETTASVWHKELLFALASGVWVLGAASMGALRAAECARFGMQPIGEIAENYASGILDDDAAVAQLHAPREMGNAPITEALVDVEATVLELTRLRLASSREAGALLASARGIFFKDRTIDAMIDAAQEIGDRRKSALKSNYRRHRVSAKQRDALALVDALRKLPLSRRAPPADWLLARTPEWRRSLVRLARSDAGATPT